MRLFGEPPRSTAPQYDASARVLQHLLEALALGDKLLALALQLPRAGAERVGDLALQERGHLFLRKHGR